MTDAAAPTRRGDWAARLRRPVDATSVAVFRILFGLILLGGRLSEPLLRSLFDPHSPGHDGAVVLRQDTVVRFAAQLPLSTDFQQLRGAGTRHSAALGLSERAVEKHINSVFAKLALAEEPDAHRRVKAVLLYLADQR